MKEGVPGYIPTMVCTGYTPPCICTLHSPGYTTQHARLASLTLQQCLNSPVQALERRVAKRTVSDGRVSVLPSRTINIPDIPEPGSERKSPYFRLKTI